MEGVAVDHVITEELRRNERSHPTSSSLFIIITIRNSSYKQLETTITSTVTTPLLTLLHLSQNCSPLLSKGLTMVIITNIMEDNNVNKIVVIKTAKEV